MIIPKQFKGAVIFDLDGCVADDRNRRPYLPQKHDGSQPGFSGNPSDYDKYHEDQIGDPIFQFSLNAIRAAVSAGFYIVFLTARPVKYHSTTVSWINSFVWMKGHEIQHVLIMRRDDDLRGSVEYKREWTQILKNTRRLVAAFDDRADIVEMYRQEGVQAWALDHEGLDVDDPKADELPQWLAGNLTRTNPEAAQADGPSQPAKEIACPANGKPVESPSDAGDILMSMGETFKERNALYKDNAVLVGKIMEVMFPDGVTLKTPEDFHMWHLFELKIVKLTRFVKSGLTHADSIHDDAIYSAMCERLVGSHSIKVN